MMGSQKQEFGGKKVVGLWVNNGLERSGELNEHSNTSSKQIPCITGAILSMLGQGQEEIQKVFR